MESEAVNSKEQNRIEQIQKLLDQYSEKVLFKLQIPQTPPLEIKKEILRKMTIEDINEWRFEIAQYLLALQNETNKHKAIAIWATGALRSYLGVKAHDYEGYSFEERKMAALKHDNYAKHLNKLQLESEAILNRIEFIPARYNTMLEIAKDIVWAKRKEESNAESRN